MNLMINSIALGILKIPFYMDTIFTVAAGFIENFKKHKTFCLRTYFNPKLSTKKHEFIHHSFLCLFLYRNFHHHDIFSKEHQTRESKRLITEIYKGVDEERVRISREPHHTVAQELFGASLKIESIGRCNEEDLNDLSIKIRETITEIRNVCYNLNPTSFIDDTYFEITLALHLKARKIILTLLNIE